jgi:hypothetical protein
MITHRPLEEDTRGRDSGSPHPSAQSNFSEFRKVMRCYETKEGLYFVIHDYEEKEGVPVVTDPKFIRFSLKHEKGDYDWILNLHQTWDSFNKKLGEAINMLMMRGYLRKV